MADTNAPIYLYTAAGLFRHTAQTGSCLMIVYACWLGAPNGQLAGLCADSMGLFWLYYSAMIVPCHLHTILQDLHLVYTASRYIQLRTA